MCGRGALDILNLDVRESEELAELMNSSTIFVLAFGSLPAQVSK